MPIPASIQPSEFKRFLEAYGYTQQHETEYNWTLLKENSALPVIVINKIRELVEIEIMMGILNKLEMNDGEYLRLLSQIKN